MNGIVVLECLLFLLTLCIPATAQKIDYLYINKYGNRYEIVANVSRKFHGKETMIVSRGSFSKTTNLFHFRDSLMKYQFYLDENNPKLGKEFGELSKIQDPVFIEEGSVMGHRIRPIEKTPLKIPSFKCNKMYAFKSGNFRKFKKNEYKHRMDDSSFILFRDAKFDFFMFGTLISAGDYRLSGDRIAMHDTLKNADFDLIRVGDNHYVAVRSFPFLEDGDIDFFIGE